MSKFAKIASCIRRAYGRAGQSRPTNSLTRVKVFLYSPRSILSVEGIRRNVRTAHASSLLTLRLYLPLPLWGGSGRRDARGTREPLRAAQSFENRPRTSETRTRPFFWSKEAREAEQSHEDRRLETQN